MARRSIAALIPFVALTLSVVVSSGDEPRAKPYSPHVAGASGEGEKAMRRFRVPAGIHAKLWAAEPLLANPVAFCFDEKGRCFVAETFRLHHGVTDNRHHMNWLEDDIACRTVADRVAMYRKFAKEKFAADYETEHDRVKLVWDSTGRGVADQSTVFADGFKTAAEGLGSGVLAHKGHVYYTCIPDLWMFKDPGNGQPAANRKSLGTGFGVHVAFLGHDMHGLTIGPDGRLYFSIGDRGLNVKTKEGKHLFVPDCGAVLRCELDGSHLEVVHTGLRNPQELTFDRFGNLFTVDNNSDSGDQARLVQIVEGGDSGWRMFYQYGSPLSDRGAWNAEKLWHLPHEGQAAYVIPPLAHISAGPSGLTYHPGVSMLPDKYRDHFFLSDFRGSGGGSGVWAFQLKPKGASFDISHREQFIWSILATDCDFGPDGAFYVSDWTDGWNCTGKGRIYRFGSSAAETDAGVAQTRKLISEGFDNRQNDELLSLLAYPDQRVRLGAQFALAAKGPAMVPALAKAAKASPDQMGRLHALWALGQLARTHPGSTSNQLLELVQDPDAEIRAQAVRLVGDCKPAPAMAGQVLAHATADPDPRVRHFAALALGRVEPAPQQLLKILADDGDRDPYLRHAAVMGLTHQRDFVEKLDPAKLTSPAVRLGVVLALRRLRSPKIADYLQDSEPRVVVEAVRAIHDLPIAEALPKIAPMLDRISSDESLLWRALNANYRLGESSHAKTVASFAANVSAPAKLRIEAVKMLGDWETPGRRDRVLGEFRPLPPRGNQDAVAAMRTVLTGIFSGPEALRTASARVVAKLGIKEVGKTLADICLDRKQPPGARAASLSALGDLKDSRLNEVLSAVSNDGEPSVRAVARSISVRQKPAEIAAILEPALDKGATIERQSALAILAEVKSPEADALLERWFEKLRDGSAPPDVHLEILEAAQARSKAERWKRRLAAFEAGRNTSDPLAKWTESMAGGNADNGRQLFLTKSSVSCVRCHKLNGVGGDVGPELNGIGSKQTRAYLLESITLPDKQIAKGFDTVVLELTDGKTVTGVLRSEDDRELKIVTADGTPLTFAKATIEERRRGPSAMPADLVQKLTPRELRDLVEFLSQLK